MVASGSSLEWFILLAHVTRSRSVPPGLPAVLLTVLHCIWHQMRRLPSLLEVVTRSHAQLYSNPFSWSPKLEERWKCESYGHAAVSWGGREHTAVYDSLRICSSSEVLQSVPLATGIWECCMCLTACSMTATFWWCRSWSTEAAWLMLEMYTCVAQ